MTGWDSNSYIFLETLLFLGISTTFLTLVGWAWRLAKPYELPRPLPAWFKVWFLTVQLVGGLLPLVVMALWGVWWNHNRVLTVFIPYFVALGGQILSESVALRWFHSIVWVMVPYLYVPYRIWQLYQGWRLLRLDSALVGIQNLLLVVILLWTLSYSLNLSQLPRLLYWEVKDGTRAS